VGYKNGGSKKVPWEKERTGLFGVAGVIGSAAPRGGGGAWLRYCHELGKRQKLGMRKIRCGDKDKIRCRTTIPTL